MEGTSQLACQETPRNAAVVREAIKAIYSALDQVEPGSPAAAAYWAALARRETELAEIEQGGRLDGRVHREDAAQECARGNQGRL